MKFKFILFFTVFCCIWPSVHGQVISSPYTSYGLGDLSGPTLPHNEGMGNVGIGMASYYFINSINPAWLTYNTLTSFQVGVKTDSRRLTGAGNEATLQSGSLSHMALLFPIKPGKWTTAVTLLPFSTVNYEFQNITPIENTSETVSNFYSGQGGLSQVTWAHGLRFFNKINVGISASYIFGSIQKKVENFINRDSLTVTDFFIRYQDISTYGDIVFGISTGYRHMLSEENYMSFGATFDLPGNLTGTKEETLSRLDNSASIEFNSIILNPGSPVSYGLPAALGVGLSYEKVNILQVGVDAQYKSWSNPNGANADILRNTMSLNVGAHFTPDYKSISSYLKRVNYRIGASFQQLPYLVNQTEINDFGVNFGASFPVSGLSSVDSAVKLGVRGTTDNQLIRETYFQFVFGMTINDRWFIKRRYD